MAKKLTLAQFAAKVDRLGTDVARASLRGVRSAGRRLQTFVVEALDEPGPFSAHPPNDTGELKRSIKYQPIEDGAVIFADAPHAPFIEYGTRPHFPPLEPLKEWALRKGLADNDDEAMAVALSVARKIAHHGTVPHAFMARAVDRLKREKILEKEVNFEVEKVLNK